MPDAIAAPHRADPAALRCRFDSARPFRHLVLDGFLDEAFADALLAQFPPFERGSAVAEDGSLGNKSTVERIRGLGPAYAALDDLVQSRPFLDWLSGATGIPDLLYDPWYFGGGTHENRNGQDLDAHVDFNRHPVEPWHRRLNLIVYLNRQWQDEWGGSLQLHSDPRADDDQVSTITPLFNRAVVFETTEWSWHAFPPIRLPAGREGESRRSVALYFYSRERPADELAPTHSTIYVDRPLPGRFRPGHVLDEADVQELRVLLKRRDMHLQRLYGDLAGLNAQLEGARAALARGLLGRIEHFARRTLARLRRR
ncbi:MAG: 2OG-Fe(II) oxygenase [Pseudoxanthomonas sp.]|nr:2OG-Fe(II) oxygenase [Pseudoxanthomonas sp.]